MSVDEDLDASVATAIVSASSARKFERKKNAHLNEFVELECGYLAPEQGDRTYYLFLTIHQLTIYQLAFQR
jgi:hypothetical protein